MKRFSEPTGAHEGVFYSLLTSARRASAARLTAMLLLALSVSAVRAGQGAGRMLYTPPNTTFIEHGGESVVSINDVSGSIAILQTSINNARSANPTKVIVIHLLANATYSVSSAGLVLNSRECLVASGATIQAVNSSVTVPLIAIASGSTKVSVAGGTLDGNGAYIQGIYAPEASRVNIDQVAVKNCGQDCILLRGRGNSTYDNEMSVTRCDVSGSTLHAGISIQNSTQTIVADNHCHDNAEGLYLTGAWATVVNNSCHDNTTGIDVAGGNDNVVSNNTCDHNGTGIRAGGSNNMITSNSMGENSTVGIKSNGSDNTFVDNLFTVGNAINFTSGGSGNRVIAYRAPLNAPGQNYFYPPLIDDQHSFPIVNGKGRTDLTIGSTTIANVQSQYDAARSAYPNNVIVLHLNGTFTVGSNPLRLSSDTCVLLNGTIQINSSTTASSAVSDDNSPTRVSISGGIIDGGGLTGNNGIQFSDALMLQVDNMTLRNFGPSNPRKGGSDIIHFDHGSTPYIVTRCALDGGAARGIWLQLSGAKSVISDNEVTDVNQDGVDCDSSTSGCVAKFNYCHDLVRYGVFIEQSASYNTAFGNICNNDGRDINLYNNYDSYRAPVQRNTVAFNWCYDNNGIRNGSQGDPGTVTSHNFLFNNTVVSASIISQQGGTENYYSQNYQVGSLSTNNVEAFFNSPDVDANMPILDRNSGLAVLVQGASTVNGAPVVTGQPGTLGNDLWSLVPTDSGYYQIKNKRSDCVMAVSGASTVSGAPVVQWSFGSGENDQWMPVSAGSGLYNLVNRHSGLYLEVTGASLDEGTQLTQQYPNDGPHQEFNLNGVVMEPPPPFYLVASPPSQIVERGNGTNFTVTLTTNAGFSGPISLTLSPDLSSSHINASFNPATFTGAGSATLTVTTASNTPAGSYDLTISAANGNSAYVTLNVSAPVLPLPDPWTSDDVGSPAIAGSAALSNGAFVVTGGGSDIWGASDQFHFAHQDVNGDLTITARVTGQTETDPWAKAGMMIRQSTAANAAYVGLYLTPGNGVSMQYRGATGVSATDYARTTGLTVPQWLRLVRSGNTFRGYRSTDGQVWDPVGTNVIANMASAALAGLAVTSHNVDQSSTVVFDNIKLGVPDLPAGWSQVEVGGATFVGNADFDNAGGAYSITGSGSDIWGTSDQFHFAYQPVTGGGTLTARVVSQGNTYVWAKAGVMIRQSTNADSAQISTFVTPTASHGASLQYRPTAGASSVDAVQVNGPAVPYWVRLVRAGNMLRGFQSSDGQNWMQVSTNITAVSLSGTVLFGLAVASHNNDQLSEVVFDNVSIVQPDLELSVSPDAEAVTGGGSVNLTVSIQPLNSFTGNVALSTGTLPFGINATFNPVLILGGSGTSTLTLTTSNAMLPGLYDVDVTGTSGSLSRQFGISLEVFAADTDDDDIPDWWMLQYFHHATGQAGDLSRADDDADHDGMPNGEEFLCGTDPTSGASYLHVRSTEPTGDDVWIRWVAVGDKTYVVEAADGLGSGFSDVSEPIHVTDSGESVATFLDVGGATNRTERWYRIRLESQ